MFDANNYFQEICRTNKITAAAGYKFCRVTGSKHMEEVIQNFKYEKAYFCIDDTEDGYLFQSGGGYLERRQYYLFLIKKFSFNDMSKQHAALNECRLIYRQIVKKLIRDRRLLENDMTYLKLDRIPFYEIPGYAFSGCTGIHFTIIVDIPIELCYDGNEWNLQ
ncbi:MAG: hypothetical protein LBP72_06640 [Dysgonamonadaceae bacterium]|jgi:hypothetical protein|nr:hypothetical protein [Dysgonamonadaceae bacterium]